MAQTTIDGRLEASRTTTCEVGRGSPVFLLPIEPVREFHQEPIVGPQVEEIVHVATEAAGPLDPRGPLATLTPHDEEGGPRPVMTAAAIL